MFGNFGNKTYILYFGPLSKKLSCTTAIFHLYCSLFSHLLHQPINAFHFSTNQHPPLLIQSALACFNVTFNYIALLAWHLF